MARKKWFVQIINETEKKGNQHVRFECKSKAIAEGLNADLIKLFRKWHIDSAMGSYQEGEECPVCTGSMTVAEAHGMTKRRKQANTGCPMSA